MDQSIELPVTLPGLRATRGTSSSLKTGVKEHYCIGRLELGSTEWWGGGRIWRSRPGAIVLKQPGDVVRHIAQSGPCTYLAVTLPTGDVTRVRDDGKPVALLAHLESSDARGEPFRRLLDAVSANADRLALEVATAEAVQALAVVSGGTQQSRSVRLAASYIREHLSESVKLDDLAAHTGLDKFRLCRAFRAQMGMPPHTYLTHLRIARAKELLRGGIRAGDAALVVGFYDQAQLTHHFRRVVGTTPARYAKDSAKRTLR